MPFVKLNTNYSTPTVQARAGKVIQVSDEEAKDLENGGYAEVVENPEKPVLPIRVAERKPKPKPEPATNRRSRRST